MVVLTDSEANFLDIWSLFKDEHIVLPKKKKKRERKKRRAYRNGHTTPAARCLHDCQVAFKLVSSVYFIVSIVHLTFNEVQIPPSCIHKSTPEHSSIRSLLTTKTTSISPHPPAPFPDRQQLSRACRRWNFRWEISLEGAQYSPAHHNWLL